MPKFNLLAMPIAPQTILRPFGVNPVSRCLGRHARFGFRASSAEAVNWENKQESSKGRRNKKISEETGLKALYDDGFGSVTMKDYLEAVRAMPKDDGGPPRWFCHAQVGRWLTSHLCCCSCQVCGAYITRDEGS
ncbi:uncharacterized protein LOC119352287 isoform X1 [Triticum dicoccoides]|uniref:uncharacterized protein LOC119352287 isoform X1 n=1 Tax=Triticum dicoccoides TaxID=85692 RepID=UPI000843F9F1|nr:uncharacterized protein LOC119352287 isoform X1 [Triticum dicoccoides]